MQVGAGDVALHRAFGPIRAVVAVADHDLAERPGLRSEEGAAAVVLETDEARRGECVDLGPDDDVADEALLARLRCDVDHADAIEFLAVRRLVVVAEELVAAAHREHLRAILFDGSLQRLVFELPEVVVDEGLLAVLAAAEEEDVDVVHLARRTAAGMTRSARPFSCSKSTSQIHETSVPSALRSLRPMMKFLPPARSTAVRTVSLKPAGFLLSTRTRWRPRNSTRSWRPNAALNVRSLSAM